VEHKIEYFEKCKRRKKACCRYLRRRGTSTHATGSHLHCTPDFSNLSVSPFRMLQPPTLPCRMLRLWAWVSGWDG